MARGVLSCAPDHALSCAAKIMWDHDCGSVPVVDERGKAVGMVTDRDICMAAFTRDLAPSQMTVGSVCSRALVAVREDESIEAAERLMQRHKVRRLPVIDAEGRPVGVLSIGDLARHARLDQRYRAGDIAPDGILTTLAAVSTPAFVEHM
ncbi:MAG TPA: CBS domain-containing protein [Polyangiaceae bacterium]